MNNNQQIQTVLRDVEGWLTTDEALLLHQTASRVSSGHKIVEIGSWKGRSTICLSLGSIKGNQAKVVAIDPHTGSSEHHKWLGEVDTFEEFCHNITKWKVKDIVETLRMTSADASQEVDDPVGFVFIDGAHEFRFVREDFRLWFPKVVDGGLIAFHDTWHFPGPNLATALILLFSTKVRNTRIADTITIFEKCERNSLTDRLRNIASLISRTLFGVKGFNKLKKTV